MLQKWQEIYLVICTGLFSKFVVIHSYTYLSEYDIIQERSYIKFLSPNVYVKNVSIVTGRPYRRAPYTTNLTAVLLAPASREISGEVTVYEKRNSDYRRGVITMTKTLCSFIDDSVFYPVLSLFANVAKSCPVMPYLFEVRNFAIPEGSPPRPPKMMAIQLRLNIEGFYTGTGERFIIVEHYFRTVPNSKSFRPG